MLEDSKNKLDPESDPYQPIHTYIPYRASKCTNISADMCQSSLAVVVNVYMSRINPFASVPVVIMIKFVSLNFTTKESKTMSANLSLGYKCQVDCSKHWLGGATAVGVH